MAPRCPPLQLQEARQAAEDAQVLLEQAQGERERLQQALAQQEAAAAQLQGSLARALEDRAELEARLEADAAQVCRCCWSGCWAGGVECHDQACSLAHAVLMLLSTPLLCRPPSWRRDWWRLSPSRSRCSAATPS